MKLVNVPVGPLSLTAGPAQLAVDSGEISLWPKGHALNGLLAIIKIVGRKQYFQAEIRLTSYMFEIISYKLLISILIISRLERVIFKT